MDFDASCVILSVGMMSVMIFEMEKSTRQLKVYSDRDG
jgi:hypothetical protein